jgi:hypothetical protein
LFLVNIDILEKIDLKKIAEHFHDGEKAINYLTKANLSTNGQLQLVFENIKKYQPND